MNHRIFNAVYRQPWNIQPGAWESIHSTLQARHEVPVSGGLDDFFIQRQPLSIDSNGIATVDIRGILGDLTEAEKQCGGTDYGDLVSDVHLAARSAKAMLGVFSSPGGQAANNVETAREFANFPGPKAAFIEGVGASAAYCIAVGADHIVTQPSAMIGSIGTILPFVDQSDAWKQAGIKADYIVSGDLKGAGFPPSLTEGQRESLQEIVDDTFSLFRSHVLRFRSISDDNMRGQSFVGVRGTEKNLADRVGAQSDAYAWLLSKL